ncbi:MAG: PEP-CTERM system histidine kinase PrsK [Emcibacteraceae bacterium]
MGSLALNISFMTYGLAAMAYAVLFGLLIDKKQYKEENIWLSVAVLASILWGFIHVIDAVAGAYTTNIALLTLSYLIPFADWLKGVLWALFLYNHLRHIWNSQGNQTYSNRAGTIIAVFIIIGFIIEGANFASQWGIIDRSMIGRLPLFNKLLVSFSILLLVENLYRNIASENRWGVRFFCLGLGSIYAFNFLLYSDSVLYALIDPDLFQARGVVNIIVVPLMAVAISRRANWSVGVSLSRKAAFHMVSLIAGIAYLMSISVLGYYIRSFGGDWGKILQVSFIFAAFIGFVVIIYSGRIRSTILVLLNKYFFMYKFDYREEWLRFIQTMTASEDHYNIQERAIKAVANIMDSPGGSLWYLEKPDSYSQIAMWNFRREIDEELQIEDPFVNYIEKNHWVVDLNDIEGGKIPETDIIIPQWISQNPDFWLLVPLIHHNRMIGFIIIYQPRAARELNWETIDILKTVSLQIASYLAEQETLKALSIASEFDAFNRKFAFVIHDIKNMASQLSLLQRNADKHGDNPEFQKDMKLTVKNTVEKMNELLSRINIVNEPSKTRNFDVIDIKPVITASVETFKTAGHNVTLNGMEDTYSALSNQDDLETVLMHIIQNALDASEDQKPVEISLVQDKNYVMIKVADSGTGMDKEFIRNELFRPFRSLKEGGYGIGAYESRQLIQNMSGRMEVKSKPGTGTLVTIYLKKE